MSQLPPAGWHPDPLGRHAQRYWDGQQWTEHVADQAGNMSTDPLNLGAQAQQQERRAEEQPTDTTTGGWGETTGESQATGEAAQERTSRPSWEREAGDGESWGREEPTEEPAWGRRESDGPSWAQPDTASADTTAEGTTTEPHAETPEPTTEEPAAEHRGGDGGWPAAGAAATAGAAAAEARHDEPTTTEHATAEPTTTEPPATETTTSGDTAPMAAAGEAEAVTEEVGAHAASAGAVAVPVGNGLTVRTANVVARNASVTTEPRDDDHVHLTGAGQVWLGSQGRAVSVLDVDTPGLTVSRAHLVAHSDGLSQEDSSDGVAGFDGVRFSGTGWVAIAARGGTTEIPTVGGLEVAATALVAYTTGLDVSHATTVSLVGRGVALVAGG